jgi:hypothetical protein
LIRLVGLWKRAAAVQAFSFDLCDSKKASQAVRVKKDDGLPPKQAARASRVLALGYCILVGKASKRLVAVAF